MALARCMERHSWPHGYKHTYVCRATPIGYTPVVGDYDGDGKTDFTVYHEPSGTWYVRLSTTGNIAIESFGAAGYLPVL